MSSTGQQYNPTVNIVISYDVEAMIAFQESENFSAFANARKKYDDIKRAAHRGGRYRPQTHLFNNAPASTFVEIMDPQGVFEDSMLDSSIQSFLNDNNHPEGAVLQKKKEDIIFLKSERQLLLRKKNHFLYTNVEESLRVKTLTSIGKEIYKAHLLIQML